MEEEGQVEEEGDQAECLNELQEPDDNKIDGIFCDFITDLKINLKS